ncbi:MAG TPA: hypothetical protein PKD72_05870 [Gemmatales bacterium]|nr:hypothetical protein [Gemmatales bacterium]
MAAASHLGFLTILQDQQGYTGGYLVTNGWGRPLEFRITSPIMPNKVQQLLYGATLRPYVCSELIGKTLIEKTSTPADLIITDHEAAQELRELVSGPLVWFASQEQLNNQGKCENRIVAQGTSGALLVHPKHLGDISPIKNILLQTEIIDLSEPFSRVREALTEVRKLNNFKAA